MPRVAAGFAAALQRQRHCWFCCRGHGPPALGRSRFPTAPPILSRGTLAKLLWEGQIQSLMDHGRGNARQGAAFSQHSRLTRVRGGARPCRANFIVHRNLSHGLESKRAASHSGPDILEDRASTKQKRTRLLLFHFLLEVQWATRKSIRFFL